ncbi:hypothetical protein CYY_004959 [Polysphondylium violaceum]|uniref:EamA domain-containing protein n=1 Tax=Polysphondylium violaceum TaxID=133409 RepID=A0A8J4USK4_9MYCE|nr:hypothetical protein CYY_004959 [Polysphondylium violaceum]
MTNSYDNDNIVNEETPILAKNGTATEIQEEKLSFAQRFLGIFIVISIMLFMVSTAELSQHIVGNSYQQPFMIIYFNTMYLMFSIPIELVVMKIGLIKEKSKKNNKINNNTYKSINDDDDNSSVDSNGDSGNSWNDSLWTRYKKQFQVEISLDENGKQVQKGTSVKRVLVTSFFMCILFVTLNYIWMMGLPLLEVGTSSALYQSATIFVFFFSIIILKEKITVLKVIPVVLFIAGVVGITIAESRSKAQDSEYPRATLGIALMLVSASLWGLYEVLTNKFFGQANRTVVNTFIGLVGFYNMFLGIPVIAVLNAIKFEILTFPSPTVFGMLVINGFLGFGLNYLINWGLSVTSPLFVRSGELMSIPCAIVFDIVFKHVSFPLVAIPGFLLVCGGFVLSLYVENKHNKEMLLEEKRLKQEKIQKQQPNVDPQQQHYNSNIIV